MIPCRPPADQEPPPCLVHRLSPALRSPRPSLRSPLPPPLPRPRLPPASAGKNARKRNHRCTPMHADGSESGTTVHGGYRTTNPGKPRLSSGPRPISVHRWFQILAWSRAAQGCRTGWSSPRAKPHAPILNRRAPGSPAGRTSTDRADPVQQPHAPDHRAATGLPALAAATALPPQPAQPHAPVRSPAIAEPPRLGGRNLRRWLRRQEEKRQGPAGAGASHPLP
jgi:hypothetical protein